MSKLFRFLVVGVVATVTHFLVVIGAVEILQADATSANAMAWATALFVSYFGHYRWTFTASGAHLEHLPRYVVVSLSGLSLNLSTVWLLNSQLGTHYLVATTLGVTLSIIVTFTLSRLWAFSA